MIKWFDALSGDRIGTEVGCDGPSLPILTVAIKHWPGTGGIRYAMLNKEQAEALVRELQRNLAEM